MHVSQPVQGSEHHRILISLVAYKFAEPKLDPQIFQEGVQRTPKFENLNTSLSGEIIRIALIPYFVNIKGMRCPRCIASDEGPLPVYK